jgi:nucleotide-binding universal stress UspA family protein
MGLERIIVPIDFSDHAAAAAELAVALAGRHRAGVTLLHVDRLPGGRTSEEPPPGIPQRLWEQFASDRAAALRALLDAMIASLGDGAPLQALLVRDETSTAIINHARKSECDLVVMGSHGADASERFLLGSVAAGVAGQAPCPVLITRTHQSARLAEAGLFSRPLVAVDDGERLDGVGRALGLMVADTAVVDLAPGWVDTEHTRSGVERKLSAAAASRELEGFDTELIASTRRPAAVLLDRLESGHNDLVVAPARSVEREGLLGIVADRLLHHSPVPVLIPRAL